MINWIFLSAGCLLSLVLGLMIIPKILLISYKKRLFDLPDSRKVHQVPVPRLGGISFFPVILISSCFILGVRVSTGFPIVELPAHEFLFFTVGGMMLFLIGVADDLIGVGYRYKFLVQIIAAFLIVCPGEWFNTLGGLFGIYELPVTLGVLFTLFVVVYITNAINLIDGIDGLASGLSCIALSVLGIICMVEGDEIYAQLAFATLGVIVPFWFYNVFGNAKRGHKLFMGDTGSLILGYIISLLVIHLSRNDMSEANDGPFPHGIGLFHAYCSPIRCSARSDTPAPGGEKPVPARQEPFSPQAAAHRDASPPGDGDYLVHCPVLHRDKRAVGGRAEYHDIADAGHRAMDVDAVGHQPGNPAA